MIFLIWILNFVISWFNAWACGKTWTETKHVGGFPHFLNWCGAIMSASGFTWCYLVIAGMIGSVWPVDNDDGTSGTFLDPEALAAFADLGYLLIIFPVIGSGIAITVHSWGVFWRRRSFGSGAVAGWNSFAQVYNTVSAIRHVPGAFDGVFSFFKGDSDKKFNVIILVIIAAVGGILTTATIIKRTARSTAMERLRQCEARNALKDLTEEERKVFG